MREYINKKQNNNIILNKFIKLLISLIVSAGIFVFLTFICSVLIAKTNVSEDYESVMMTVISAISSIVLSILMTFTLDYKGILCALFSFLIIFCMKLIISKAYGSVGFGRQGTVGLIFTAIFCLIGSIAASNIKK